MKEDENDEFFSVQSYEIPGCALIGIALVSGVHTPHGKSVYLCTYDTDALLSSFLLRQPLRPFYLLSFSSC